MDTKQMAKILYNMSLDMDYSSDKEHHEAEIEGIKEELQALKEVETPCLIYVLEKIAENNIEFHDWLEKHSTI